MKRRIRVLAVLGAAIGAIVTAHDFAKIVYEWSAPVAKLLSAHSVPIITAAATFAIILLGFWKFVIRPVVHRDFDLPAESSRITFEQHRHYRLSPRGAHGTFESHFLFLEHPSDEDLCDLFDVEGQQFPEDFTYESPDAEETERVLVDRSHLKIYWRPRAAIQPYVPYVHTKSYFIPDEYDSYRDGGYIFDIISDVPNGRVFVEIDAHHRVAQAFVVRLPRFRRLRTLHSAFHFARRAREKFGTPAAISGDRHVSWTGTNFTPGRRYALFLFYRQ